MRTDSGTKCAGRISSRNGLGVHVVELEDVFDHFLFVGLDRTLLLADVHHHADFLFRHALRGVGGLKVKGLQQRAADPVGGLRHRREQPYGPFRRGGDALERLLRPAGGERAGENARQREGDDAEGNQRNQRAQRRGNMQRGAHAGADRPRQRRKGRGDQRGVGHSDFTEAIVIAVQQPQHALGGRILLGLFVQLGSVHGGQRVVQRADERGEQEKQCG